MYIRSVFLMVLVINIKLLSLAFWNLLLSLLRIFIFENFNSMDVNSSTLCDAVINLVNFVIFFKYNLFSTCGFSYSLKRQYFGPFSHHVWWLGSQSTGAQGYTSHLAFWPLSYCLLISCFVPRIHSHFGLTLAFSKWDYDRMSIHYMLILAISTHPKTLNSFGHHLRS